jgi:glycerophosphoryl diester phosphodiesterase
MRNRAGPRNWAWRRRFRGEGPMLGVAHRGASRHAPENTLAAFRMALEQGIPAVECDVRPTQDGHVVVIHDSTVDRTTDGLGVVSAMRLEALRRLDAGRWFAAEFAGERIPLLEEVLELVRGRALIQIEIKNDPTPYDGIESQVIDAVRRRGVENQVLVMSFDHQSVLTVRSLSSEIATGILYAARLVDAPAAARAAGADALCLDWAYIDREVVAQAHAAGLGICVWTVDDEPIFRRCQEFGADAVASNDLRLLLRLAGEA